MGLFGWRLTREPATPAPVPIRAPAHPADFAAALAADVPWSQLLRPENLARATQLNGYTATQALNSIIKDAIETQKEQNATLAQILAVVKQLPTTSGSDPALIARVNALIDIVGILNQEFDSQAKAIDEIRGNTQREPATRLIISVRKDEPMFQLQDDQKVTLTVAPVDAAGNPAKVDGVPTWSSSDETILTVAASDDGLSCVVTAVGPLTADGSSVQVSCTADADLGAGVTPITGSLDFTVVGGQAVGLNIATGAAEPK